MFIKSIIKSKNQYQAIKTVLEKIFEINASGDTSILIPPHLIELAQRLNYITPKKNADAGCKICENAVAGIIALRRSNATRDVMIDYFNHICLLFTNWGTEGCKGNVNIETVKEKHYIFVRNVFGARADYLQNVSILGHYFIHNRPSARSNTSQILCNLFPELRM